jgi:hypothetical protein
MPILELFPMASIPRTFYLLLLSFLGLTKGFGSGSLTVFYGCTYLGNTGVYFTNSSQAGFSSSNTGVLAVGYFTHGYNVLTEAPRLVEGNFQNFLSNFNLLASTNFNNYTFAGFIPTETETIPEQSVGSIPYVLVLGGISSFADALNATEISLFTDSELPPLPEGAEPIPKEYNLTSLSFDTILIGAEYSQSTIGNGNAYATQPFSDLPPVWVGANDLGDNWLYLAWFGLVFQEPTSVWTYHYHLGWVYSSGTLPGGFWVWHPEWNSWAFTGNSIFPRLWLDTEQKWIWVELHDKGVFTTQIYDSTTNQWENYNFTN